MTVCVEFAGVTSSLCESQLFVGREYPRAGSGGRRNIYRDEVVVRPVTTNTGRQSGVCHKSSSILVVLHIASDTDTEEQKYRPQTDTAVPFSW